jgi:hypothetical protein
MIGLLEAWIVYLCFSERATIKKVRREPYKGIMGQSGIIPKCAKLSPEKFFFFLWRAKVIHRLVDFCTLSLLNTASNLAM